MKLYVAASFSRILVTSVFAMLAVGCPTNTDIKTETGETAQVNADSDNDGYPASEDCDDSNPNINAGADEICNGLDDNCDQVIDEGVTTTYYQDGDADGFGTDASTTDACDKPVGYTPTAGDCDDSNGLVYPGAMEACDGVDNDCDGSTDEDGSSAYYKDADVDGYGDPLDVAYSCSPPEGYVDNDDDCDDTTPTVYPDAEEVCDEQDNDCDGVTDEDVTHTYYADTDGDGYGIPDTTAQACSVPTGYADNADDCDDSARSVYPGATESCNEIDDDCDGRTDEFDAVDAATWYADSDGDSFGDADSTRVGCDAPPGYVADSTDCDDTVATTYPRAPEMCDGVDNDCDGTVDEDDAVDASTWYLDYDKDGFGGTMTEVSCTAPAGYVDNAADCNDMNAAISPAGTEVCDGVDNDCDGSTDEDDASGAPTWYLDFDKDGYGGVRTTTACSEPSGYVSTAGDCDDRDAAVNPSAFERCDAIDNDCDSVVDEDDAVDASTWYQDADGDSFGNRAVSDEACFAPSGYVSDATDCDDTAAAVYPSATEVCNGIDDNCDGTVDEGTAADASTWYQDADGDGFGDLGTSMAACSVPTGYVADATDCDDTLSNVNPAATEVCDDLDNDCNGTVDDPGVVADGTTWYVDSDWDGFGDPASTLVACEMPSGYSDNNLDCDDATGAEPVVVDWAAGSPSGLGTIRDPLSTIQDGIDAANECVVVFPGTYYESIDFSGKNLDVAGIEGADTTIIDAHDIGGPVATFQNGETSEATLRGFTLTGGAGALEESSESAMCTSVIECTTYTSTWCGGGVYANGADPTLQELNIRDNTLPSYAYTTTGYDTYITLSFGGAACFIDSLATLSDFDAEANSADVGGGFFVDTSSNVEIRRGWVRYNTAGHDGGGMEVDGGTVTYKNVASVENEAGEDGGGVLVIDGDFTAINVTHGREGAPTGGAIYLDGLSAFSMANSIIYGATSGEGVLASSTASLTAVYNNVYGNAAGNYVGVSDPSGTNGNISVDPLFTTAWTLDTGSPSIDAGNPVSTFNDADGSLNDQGAFGGPDSDWND